MGVVAAYPIPIFKFDGGLQKKLTQTNEKMHGKTSWPAYHKFVKLPFSAC
jgi:hypothetical protein